LSVLSLTLSLSLSPCLLAQSDASFFFFPASLETSPKSYKVKRSIFKKRKDKDSWVAFIKEAIMGRIWKILKYFMF